MTNQELELQQELKREAKDQEELAARALEIESKVLKALRPWLNSAVPLDPRTGNPTYHWWREIQAVIEAEGLQTEIDNELAHSGGLVIVDDWLNASITWTCGQINLSIAVPHDWSRDRRLRR